MDFISVYSIFSLLNVNLQPTLSPLIPTPCCPLGPLGPGSPRSPCGTKSGNLCQLHQRHLLLGHGQVCIVLCEESMEEEQVGSCFPLFMYCMWRREGLITSDRSIVILFFFTRGRSQQGAKSIGARKSGTSKTDV